MKKADLLIHNAAQLLTCANKIWKDLLKYYEQPPLDEAIDEELKNYVDRQMIELDGVELYS